ncbi:hypothetical protein DDZ18_04955 [Marinicauda salina]|uniref:DJ-1/PfpI domain-containing protein n=1 Tax=Marinicauda salina TaxID=2135793 RepID=A0A2U2BV71_9PROT|nr:DJ-1/PfpI family protein [Marinicauda salina]PWE17926.1 hypothetical protein DDZ18_04955 [Marinicauda salina]
MAVQNRHPRQKRIDLEQVGESGEIAALVAEGFDVDHFNLVAHAAERGGFRTMIVSPQRSLVSGRSGQREEMNFVVDKHPGDVGPSTYDGLLVPGGVTSVKALMKDQDARLLVLDYIKANKPVFALGDAVELLAEVSEKEGVAGVAALALNGEIFAGDGETAQEDAASAFVDALTVKADDAA